MPRSDWRAPACSCIRSMKSSPSPTTISNRTADITSSCGHFRLSSNAGQTHEPWSAAATRCRTCRRLPRGSVGTASFFAEVRDRLEPVGSILPAVWSAAAIAADVGRACLPDLSVWSVLEAVSAGALVIGSRTLRCRNSILCDFFDADGIADAIVDVLANPGRCRALRDARRRTFTERFVPRRIWLPAWLALLDRRHAISRTVRRHRR